VSYTSGAPELVTGWSSRGEVGAGLELPDRVEGALAHTERAMSLCFVRRLQLACVQFLVEVGVTCLSQHV
jgi:hypothetical protein